MWCNGLDATISSIIEADPSIGYKALAIKLADMGMHVTLDTMKHYMNGIICLVDAKEYDCSLWHILDNILMWNRKEGVFLLETIEF